jgi:hypothetical protein
MAMITAIKKQTAATLHQGKYKPAEKLESINSISMEENFMIGFFMLTFYENEIN